MRKGGRKKDRERGNKIVNRESRRGIGEELRGKRGGRGGGSGEEREMERKRHGEERDVRRECGGERSGGGREVK